MREERIWTAKTVRIESHNGKLKTYKSKVHIHKLNSNSTSTHTPIRSVEVTLEEAMFKYRFGIHILHSTSTSWRRLQLHSR